MGAITDRGAAHFYRRRQPLTQDGRQPPIEIAPSILSADFSRVGEQVRDVLEGARGGSMWT